MEYSGFFNALRDSNGLPDRTYKAEDYSSNLAVVISNGVLLSNENDLAPSVDGMIVNIGAGRAWIKGNWYHNDAILSFDIPTASTGYSRFDRVVLRYNNNLDARKISLVYLEGTTAANPVKPELTRTASVWDLCICDIYIAANSTAATVADTRADSSVCGWVYSTVGDGTYFDSYNEQFYDWFNDKKDTLSTTTAEVSYEERIVLPGSSNQVTITMDQYDSTKDQKIEVYVNGIYEFKGIDYTVSGNVITFDNAMTTGTEIIVKITVPKDGSGISSVVGDVTSLQNRVAALEQNVNETTYNYICNGVDDNVKLSDIAQAWLDGGTDYGSLKVSVFGEFGATAANTGSGTSANPYNWFDFGKSTIPNRKIFFDFSDCSQININAADGTFNTIFYGLEVNLTGVNIVATGGTRINMFSTSPVTIVNADRCRFWITSVEGYISRGGTFRDCRTSLTTNSGNAYSFICQTGGLIRIFGGEHYAYAPAGMVSAVVFVDSNQTGAVVLTYGMNCPKVARGGYVQTYVIRCLSNSANCSFTDTITTLDYVAEGNNNRGYIRQNLPGMM